VTFDRHVQTPRDAPGQTRNIPLGVTQLRQHRIGQLQQTQPGAGETHRLGLAHEQRHAHALFQFLELVRQSGLGQVQPVGGVDQAVRLAQGMQGFKVAYLKHRGAP